MIFGNTGGAIVTQGAAAGKCLAPHQSHGKGLEIAEHFGMLRGTIVTESRCLLRHLDS